MANSKLIRDNILEIIKKDNHTPVTHIADDNEYYAKLIEKLLEESDEFIADPNPEELADILEVLYALCDYLNLDREKLERIRSTKAQERGSFKGRIILDKIE